MPTHCGEEAGRAPSPISVEVTGAPVILASSRNSWLAAGPELMMPRPLGRGEHLDRRLDRAEVALDRGLIGLVAKDRAGRLAIARGRDLDVLGQVDDDRAGAAGGGDVERLVDRLADLGRVLHQIVMLGAVAGDADRVAFLKGVGADQMGRHLAGDDDDRDRIHQRVGDAGDGIGRAGAGGHQDDAGLAGRTGIALGSVDRALLMADEDVADALLLEQRVVDRQDRAAGIAEHHLDPEVGQGLDQNLRATQLGRHRFCL
jgi:hypothetical protein